MRQVADLFAARGYYTRFLLSSLALQALFTANGTARPSYMTREASEQANIRVIDGHSKVVLPQDGSLILVLFTSPITSLGGHSRGDYPPVFAALPRGIFASSTIQRPPAASIKRPNVSD